MFKVIQEMFGRKNLLQEALEESWNMLQIDKEMFDASVTSLRKYDTADVEIDIYKTDKEINRFEQDVRKKVLTHLAVSRTSDLTIGLTLVSIISDIERIGDYTKNIYELATIHPKRLKAGKWEDSLHKMESTVSARLATLIEALKESDTNMGRQIIDDLINVKDKCDHYIMFLIKGEGETFKTSEAVPLALYMRYIKRVSGHIQNVASSLVNPFHRIKYQSKHTKLFDNK
jgi:phosphate uptake regulator